MVETNTKNEQQGERDLPHWMDIYQSLAEKSPVGLFIIQDQKFQWANLKFQENTGYDSKDLIGMPSLSLVYPDDRDYVTASVRAILRGESVSHYEYRMVARSGSITWNVGMVTSIVFRERRSTLGIQMDISRQRQAEDALKLSEERSRTIIDSIADAYYEVDLAGNLMIFNMPYLKLLGYDAEQMRGMNYRSYVDKRNADIVFRAYNAVFKTGNPIKNMEFDIINKNGETRQMELSVSLMHDTLGAPKGFRGIIGDITDRNRVQETIRRQAFHDPLTGLANRILFSDRLYMALKRALRTEKTVAVLILDLDNFKGVNDRWGHAAGDTLLSQVAHRLQSLVRESDTVSRHGGDEFAILLSPLNCRDEAEQIATKIVSAFQNPFYLEAHEVMATVSVGVALFPDHADHFDALIKKADVAMYRAKDEGRSRYFFYDKNPHSPASRVKEGA